MMETLLFPSLKSSLKRLAGLKARLSTLTSLGTDSSSEKWSQSMANKMLELLSENERLKEELRLRDLSYNCEHDV